MNHIFTVSAHVNGAAVGNLDEAAQNYLAARKD
jgi:hypothetical protein